MKKPLFLLPSLLFCMAAAAAAGTRYVTDQLSVTMRRGQGTQYRIVDSLKSGQAVEVLTTHSNTGYSQVRTSDGHRGWVLTRFLTGTRGARQRLAEAQNKLGHMQNQNQALQGKLTALQGSRSTLTDRLSRLRAENGRLKTNLQEVTSKASHTLRISKANKRLRARVANLDADRARLQSQNKALKSRRQGLEIGAFILLAGIIMGLILPRLRLRRRSAWDRY